MAFGGQLGDAVDVPARQVVVELGEGWCWVEAIQPVAAEDGEEIGSGPCAALGAHKEPALAADRGGAEAEFGKVVVNGQARVLEGGGEGRAPVYEITGSCNVRWVDGAKGYRLPPEAEWEYATWAVTTTVYATGDEQGALARAGWYDGNSGGRTRDVCTVPEQPWGCEICTATSGSGRGVGTRSTALGRSATPEAGVARCAWCAAAPGTTGPRTRALWSSPGSFPHRRTRTSASVCCCAYPTRHSPPQPISI